MKVKMTRLISIRWRNLILAFLTVIGLLMLALGWSGIPQKITNSAGESNHAAPVASQGNGDTETPAGEESSPATANVITMPGQAASEDDGGTNYFVDSRLERQRARGQEIETLRTIINNPSSDEEIRSEAQQQVMAISKNISLEMELENLIRAKGFDDAVVYLKDESANVVVKSGALTTEEAARICDIVARGAGISEQNIVIIPTQ